MVAVNGFDIKVVENNIEKEIGVVYNTKEAISAIRAYLTKTNITPKPTCTITEYNGYTKITNGDYIFRLYKK